MSATIKDLDAAATKARNANQLATCTVVGSARALVMLAREGHLTQVLIDGLSAAVDAQRETEQAVALAGAALLLALSRDGAGDAPEAPDVP